MLDSVDAVGDSFDVFDDLNAPCATAIWNGRLVNIPGPMPQYPSKLFQSPAQTKPFPHHVEQLDLSDEPSEFVFAPRTFSHEFTFQSPDEIVLCKSFFHRLYHEVKEGAKKVGKLAKKALKAITHGTKKAAHKVEHFVKDHKKEILIATAVIAAVSGAFALSGVLGTSAAAVNNPPKKEEEEDKKTSASPPPPPPLPDWVQGLLQSTAPHFSPETASDAEIEQAKSEAHNAWETLNHIKALTEADLTHLRKEDPDFDPTKTAIETVLNTVLSDAQRHEFSKTSAAQQHWQDLIRTGHERIDQGFSAVAAHKAAAIAPPLPLASTLSFIDKIKLGLGNIGRSSIDPELLDPNSPWDLFLQNQIENRDKTISEFVNKIKLSLGNIGRGSIDPELLDPNSPWDLFLQNQIENREEFVNKVRSLRDIILIPNSPWNLFAKSQIEVQNQTDFSILQNLTQYFTWEKIFPPPRSDLPYPSVLTGIPEEGATSTYFKTNGINKVGMQITCVNGIWNTFKNAFEAAEYIQKWSPGNLSVDGIYNHTNGPLDFLEVFFFNYKGYSPVTQDLLMKKWTEFHEQNKDRPYAKILHFCHSQGAIHTKNALLRLPEEIRKRVIVVAIAPAAVVSRDWCYASFNYASKNDIVPLGELLSLYGQASRAGETFVEEMLMNISKYQSEIIWLEPHEGATGINHELKNLIFAPRIEMHIKDYESHDGEYR